MPVIPVLGRLRQKDYEFESSPRYTVRPCFNKTKMTTKKKKKEKERKKERKI
jgi:hypothetical protein